MRFRRRSVDFVFALLAAWCFGSQSLDAVLEQFLEDYGETPVLVQSSSGETKLAHDYTEQPSEIEVVNLVACAHYMVVKPAAIFVALPKQERIELFQSEPPRLTSVTRAPLVPPPIRHLA